MEPQHPQSPDAPWDESVNPAHARSAWSRPRAFRLAFLLFMNVVLLLGVTSPQLARQINHYGKGSVDSLFRELGIVFLDQASVEPASTLVISEVQCANRGELVDLNGHCPDWIELWNASDRPADLSGWYLTDDQDDLEKWKFPALVLDPDERIVVFASGKDLDDPNELHTNFKVAKSGEYLALVHSDGQTISQALQLGTGALTPGQTVDTTTQEPLPLMTATPGEKNSPIAEGTVAPVMLSHDSQLFDKPFLLHLSCSDTDAAIFYTTDGTCPSPTQGHRYRDALRIDGTTVIRAVACAPNRRSSVSVTKSYLHLQSLLSQPERPEGFPHYWDDTLADYAMNPRTARGREDDLVASLKSLPFVSVVAEQDELFGDEGIYCYTFERGFDWEIPAQMELLPHGDSRGFSVPCGIRIAGNESRRQDWKKHALRINFRGRYGVPTLQFPLFPQPGNHEFSSLLLRSTDDSWLSHHRSVRKSAQYIRDQWSRDTEIAMGRLAARGRFVHLCLNGLYWGVYNLMDRPDDEFLAHQLGGKADDYVTLRTRVGVLETDQNGERVWEKLFRLAGRDLTQQQHYAALEERLDIVNLIDYSLVNLYAGGEDWVLVNGNNMRAYCQTKKRAPLRFIAWDNDSTFASGWNNDSLEHVLRIRPSDDPQSFQTLFQQLGASATFRRLVVERLAHWTQPGQPLHPSTARERYATLAARIEPALLAEEARWGDVHSDGDDTGVARWRSQKERVLGEWFTDRPEKVLAALQHYWGDLIDDAGDSHVVRVSP